MSAADLCKNCRHWKKWLSGALGNCTRYPPHPTGSRINASTDPLATPRGPHRGEWPLTAPDDGCGEYKMKDWR